MVHQKITRIYSVMEAMEAGETANFESLEDSAKDAINYLSFFVSYSRGKMEGQDSRRDLVNRPVRIDSGNKGGVADVNMVKSTNLGVLNNDAS